MDWSITTTEYGLEVRGRQEMCPFPREGSPQVAKKSKKYDLPKRGFSGFFFPHEFIQFSFLLPAIKGF